MIVTKIERQKKNPERVNIFLDGIFAFGVHEEILVKFGLRKGDRVNQKQVDAMTSGEEFNQAKQKALRFINYRMRSEKEIRLKLLEKEFQPQTIEKVIAHLRSFGFIDDAKFATAFAHDTQLRKPVGRKLLQQQLRMKGVSTTIINDTLNQNLSEEEEQRRALDAAKKLSNRYITSKKKIDKLKQQKRLEQFLARRGFSWSIISYVIRKIFHNEIQFNGEC